jgi:hypothetical protein
MRQERLYLSATHLFGVPHPVIDDEAPYPVDILLLCAIAVVANPHGVSHLIKQTRFNGHAANHSDHV